MPAELPLEHVKAAEVGIDLVSLDLASPEAEEFARKLRQEGPNNVLGGFPEDINEMVSLIKGLRKELLAQGIPEAEIHLAIHSSCVNSHDCIMLYHNNGKKYHYNTKHILNYSRDEMISKLVAHGLSFREQ